MENTKVEGRTFTSNHVKLLKHLDKMQLIQEGKPTSPVMIHVSLTNSCNLACSFCCFANRDLTDVLPLEKVKKALASFRKIGVQGLEFTGGGEPTLHPNFKEIVEYAHGLGFKLGLCTNGKTLGTRVTKDTVKLFSWVRLGMYGFTENYTYDLSVFEGTNTQVSAAYIWDESYETSPNPNIKGTWEESTKKRRSTNFQKREDFLRMLNWVEENKIPTRVAFNVIKNLEDVEKDIQTIRSIMEPMNLKYAFLSDFNFKNERKNDHCFMHLFKPFLFTDGNVYVCPCAEMSVENAFKVNDKFKVCEWDTVEEYYSQPSQIRHHNCRYCKYDMQNELISDALVKTEHNEFV